MFLFGKKSKTYLGLDIGTSAIKLVELEKEEERYKLKAYGIFPMSEYLKHLGEQPRINPHKMLEEQVAEMIKQTIQAAKIKSRKVSLSIPVYSSFSTLIDLPPMPEKEIARAIPFEARKYVPIPTSEVVLDWSIVEKIKEGPKTEEIAKTEEEKVSPESSQILLVAVPKEVIAKYGRIVQLAGLELGALEAETFSLARSLVGNDKSSIVIVDTGARSSNISIIDKGYIRITHNLEVGGGELTRALSQRMNISFEKAEEMKKIGQDLSVSQKRNFEPGPTSQSSGFEIGEITHSVLDIIIVEVKKIINNYQIKYNRRVEKCILVGGGLVSAGLIDDFASKLGLEVSLGDPFARIIYLPILEPAIKEIGPCLAVAVGLAIRE